MHFYNSKENIDKKSNSIFIEYQFQGMERKMSLIFDI